MDREALSANQFLVELFVQLPTASGCPALNMATDDAMRQISAADVFGALRFYQWTGPAISIGYSQHSADLAPILTGKNLPWVRRPTGGGMVEHGKDLTWAMVIFAMSRHFRTPATQLYQILHAAIAQSLQAIGMNVTLAPCHNCSGPPSATLSACFAEPVGYDVVEIGSGSKLAGAAMKRDRNAILIQGSIQLPENGNSRFHELQTQLLKAWSEQLQITWTQSEGLLCQQIIAKQHRKYASKAWNYLR